MYIFSGDFFCEGSTKVIFCWNFARTSNLWSLKVSHFFFNFIWIYWSWGCRSTRELFDISLSEYVMENPDGDMDGVTSMMHEILEGAVELHTSCCPISWWANLRWSIFQKKLRWSKLIWAVNFSQSNGSNVSYLLAGKNLLIPLQGQYRLCTLHK